MYFHYQNLNDDHPKRYWLHGRCWLGHAFLHAEWCIPSWHSWEVEVSLNHYGDTAVGISMGLGLFWLHICTENRKLYRWLEPITKRKDQKYTNGRVVGISFHDRTLWLKLWSDPMEHRRVDPKWWDTAVHFDDLILGKVQYTRETLKEGETEIHMPEGTYPASYKVEKATWRRPRWPWSKTLTDVWFDIPVGIPHDGKGENSWDQGMDATFGIGTWWDGNIYQAAKRVALRCIETRSRRGDLNDPAFSVWRTKRITAKE